MQKKQQITAMRSKESGGFASQKNRRKKRPFIRRLLAIVIPAIIAVCGVLLLYPAVGMVIQSKKAETINDVKDQEREQEPELDLHFKEIATQGILYDDCHLFFDEDGYVSGGYFEDASHPELVPINPNDKVSEEDAMTVKGVTRVFCMKGPYFDNGSEFVYDYYAFGYDDQHRLLVVCKYNYSDDGKVLWMYKILWGNNEYPTAIEEYGSIMGAHQVLLSETSMENQFVTDESGKFRRIVLTTCNKTTYRYIDYDVSGGLGFHDELEPGNLSYEVYYSYE